MKLLVLFVLAVGAAVLFALTSHGVALVVAFVALAFLLVEAFRDEPEPLAPYRWPIDQETQR